MTPGFMVGGVPNQSVAIGNNFSYQNQTTRPQSFNPSAKILQKTHLDDALSVKNSKIFQQKDSDEKPLVAESYSFSNVMRSQIGHPTRDGTADNVTHVDEHEKNPQIYQIARIQSSKIPITSAGEQPAQAPA